MLTRRDFLVGAIAAGTILRTQTCFAKASQPSTPVNFDVPGGMALTFGDRKDKFNLFYEI